MSRQLTIGFGAFWNECEKERENKGEAHWVSKKRWAYRVTVDWLKKKKNGKRGENENKKEGERVFDVRRAVSLQSHLISPVKEKGRIKAPVLASEAPGELSPNTSYLTHLLPLHATTHTYNTSVICSGTHTGRKSSPENKNLFIIYPSSVSFQPCVMFFLLWNTKGDRNIWADLFRTTEVDGNLYRRTAKRTIKIVHATIYSKSCTTFPHSKLLNCFRICWGEFLLSILVVWKQGGWGWVNDNLMVNCSFKEMKD